MLFKALSSHSDILGFSEVHSLLFMPRLHFLFFIDSLAGTLDP